ncbi:g1255 [Coccomyxa viridis]|uniref:G1255 protein n=1 Tax=Coccomyxa viridis TaxID=1274662 RepID=A0ABP1FKI0_9CHLO
MAVQLKASASCKYSKCENIASQTTRPVVCKASQRAGTAVSDKQKLKDDITAAAGALNGLDRTEEEAARIAGLLGQLESTGQLDDLDLTGSTWRLLYSTSKGSSSGKIGPFIGRVTQVFPEDSGGQYVNKIDFGLVKADLLANYEKPQRDRINVAFEWIKFMLGPLSFKKEFTNRTPETSGGFWRLTYTDKDFRILYTNLGNVFVLVR